MLEHETYLKMRHHEWCGQDFKPEDALRCCLLEVSSQQRTASAFLERLCYAVKRLNQKRACAATWVQHVNVRIGKSGGAVKLLAQNTIHPLNHVLHHFTRGVPD